MPTKESNFKIALIDPWDKVHFGIQETIITVLKDRGKCLHVSIHICTEPYL